MTFTHGDGMPRTTGLPMKQTKGERIAELEAEVTSLRVQVKAARHIAQKWMDRGSSYATPGRRILAALTPHPRRNRE